MFGAAEGQFVTYVQALIVDLQLILHFDRLPDKVHASLHPAGAVHLASALILSASPLHTWDDSHLLPFDGELSCKDGQRLEICIPKEPPGEGLFGGI